MISLFYIDDTHNDFYGNYEPLVTAGIDNNISSAVKSELLNEPILIADPPNNGEFKFITLKSKQSSIKVPVDHPIVSYITDNSGESDTRRLALEIIVILFDKKNPNHHKYLTKVENEKSFVECFCFMLYDIIQFANFHKITPIYDYMKELFTLYSSVNDLYPLSISDWLNNHNIKPDEKNQQEQSSLDEKTHTIERSFITKYLTKLKKINRYQNLDVATELNEVVTTFSKGKSQNYIRSLICYTKSNCFKWPDTEPIIRYLISCDIREEFINNTRKKPDIYKFLTSIIESKNITLVSKFIFSYCSKVDSFDVFVPRDWMAVTDDVLSKLRLSLAKLYDLDLPNDVKCHLNFNLQIITSKVYSHDYTGFNREISINRLNLPFIPNQ